MCDYLTVSTTFAATAVKVVGAADMDRHITVYMQGGKMGFTSTEVNWDLAHVGGVFSFVLPAGVEVWAQSSGSTFEFSAIVSGVR